MDVAFRAILQLAPGREQRLPRGSGIASLPRQTEQASLQTGDQVAEAGEDVVTQPAPELPGIAIGRIGPGGESHLAGVLLKLLPGERQHRAHERPPTYRDT